MISILYENVLNDHLLEYLAVEWGCCLVTAMVAVLPVFLMLMLVIVVLVVVTEQGLYLAVLLGVVAFVVVVAVSSEIG